MATLVYAYVPLSPNQPAREIQKFRLDPDLGVLIYEGRYYDTESATDMVDLDAAQALIGRGSRFLYDAKRLRVLPPEYLRAKREGHIASRIEAVRVTLADAEEARRLAELAASAPEIEKAPVSYRDPEEGEEDPDILPEDLEPTPPLEEEDEEVPPYEEWSLAELKAEITRRELPMPKGKALAPYIAALETDDANDPS